MHALRLHPIVETLYRDRQNMFDVNVFRYRVYFPFILLFLGRRMSFVIPRTSLYRGSVYRGSTVVSFFFPHYWYQRTCHIHVREWFKFLEAKIG